MICPADQLTGFCMVETLVVEGLIEKSVEESDYETESNKDEEHYSSNLSIIDIFKLERYL